MCGAEEGEGGGYYYKMNIIKKVPGHATDLPVSCVVEGRGVGGGVRGRCVGGTRGGGGGRGGEGEAHHCEAHVPVPDLARAGRGRQGTGTTYHPKVTQ